MKKVLMMALVGVMGLSFVGDLEARRKGLIPAKKSRALKHKTQRAIQKAGHAAYKELEPIIRETVKEGKMFLKEEKEAFKDELRQEAHAQLQRGKTYARGQIQQSKDYARGQIGSPRNTHSDAAPGVKQTKKTEAPAISARHTGGSAAPDSPTAG
ncbi:hypothetical protein EIL50_04240 [bacterium NHP-B]|nr:hypothetical protein EIL50_04240 [bacterium NHP-B]